MESKEAFLSHFVASAPAEVEGPLLDFSKEAQRVLAQIDPPTRRDEEWKYTPVAPVLKQQYEQALEVGGIDITNCQIPGLAVNLLVFVNGHFSEALSEITDRGDIKILPLDKAKEHHSSELQQYLGRLDQHNHDFFEALNAAYHTQGVFIHVPKDVQVAHPIHILHVGHAQRAAFNHRNLFVAGENSKAQVISSFETLQGEEFANSVTEIHLEDGAQVEHVLIQHQGPTSKQLNATYIHQKDHSTFTQTTLTLSGAWVRNNLRIEVDGQECNTNLYGLYALSDGQHVDNHTCIRHLQPNCLSNENYKGVLKGKSTGVFNGKVYVDAIAQRIQAFQSNKNILLDDRGMMNSKPELEIYANDVKCSHGSTTGQLDSQALFYLQSRGVEKMTAKELLVNAFLQEVLEAISTSELRTSIESKLSGYFSKKDS